MDLIIWQYFLPALYAIVINQSIESSLFLSETLLFHIQILFIILFILS